MNISTFTLFPASFLLNFSENYWRLPFFALFPLHSLIRAAPYFYFPFMKAFSVISLGLLWNLATDIIMINLRRLTSRISFLYQCFFSCIFISSLFAELNALLKLFPSLAQSVGNYTMIAIDYSFSSLIVYLFINNSFY